MEQDALPRRHHPADSAIILQKPIVAIEINNKCAPTCRKKDCNFAPAK